ncbi:MAG: hypothetical protein JWN94_489 [Betaproteobacteria bacterium]|nr:hypothetical protein [Betaproteobacteria bacterium]
MRGGRPAVLAAAVARRFNGVPGTGTWINDERQGPLVVLLMIETMVTGLVDAISYLELGHVFVANMTGNVVFLGLAVADTQEFSVAASLAAMAAFLVGALAGGRLGVTAGQHRARLLAISTIVNISLLSIALAAELLVPRDGFLYLYALIVLLAVAMGMQNAVARRLAVPDMTTTVLTLTLTGIAADSALAGGKNPHPGRRVSAALVMFFGAAIGALLIFKSGIASVLMLAIFLLFVTALAACRAASSTAAWTAAA